MKARDDTSSARLDLLVMDIDGAFIYHRTMASLNAVFLTLFLGLFQETLDPRMFCTTGRTIRKAFSAGLRLHRFRWDSQALVKILRLLSMGASFHAFNSMRSFVNTLGGRISDEWMVRRWGGAIVGLGIHEASYRLEDDTIEKNIRPHLFGLYRSLKRINPSMKVLALSEHFSLGKDPIHKALGADAIVTNRFRSGRKGIIKGYDIKVASPEDRLKAAEEYARTIDAKNIGVIIEDWDDRLLLDLPGLRYVLFKPRLRRFIPRGVEAVRF